MKKIAMMFMFVALLAVIIIKTGSVQANTVWPRPIVPPIPSTVTGVANPEISLNGTWKWTKTPPANFWLNTTNPAAWNDVQIPSDLLVQDLLSFCSYPCTTDKDIEFPFKKQITIPSDFTGKKVFIRFESAFNYARVWVNGNLVKTHRGAFSQWDADITDYVTPGSTAWITIGVTAETDMIELRHVRGIPRDLKLYAAPLNYAKRLHATTDFDVSYNHATLNVESGIVFNGGTNANVNLNLKDPSGNTVAISPSTINVNATTPEGSVSIPVTSPLKWDAEHPNLYTLTATYVVDGATVETVTKKIGFREIVVSGNQLLVNGKPVKLRGVNYLFGSATKGLIASDAEHLHNLTKLKAANVNFIRTAHMAPPGYVLDLADQLGLYVEYETSVTFINSDPNAPTQNDTTRTAEYMDQLSENIEADKTHPSILYWSIGNESSWGTNMQKMLDYVKLEDPTRPNKFSWGYNAVGTSIYSSHYGSSFNNPVQPEIVDEYAHGFSGGVNLGFDPGLRDWYGQYLKSSWESIYNGPGILGGGIWNAIDSYFETPGSNGGSSNWGTLLDAWGREKTEYYNVKKVYSPDHIEEGPLQNPGVGNPLNIKVTNRHDHTNMNEMTIYYSVGENSGTITANIAPHQSGFITIPARNWTLGENVYLRFTSPQGIIEDEYNFSIGTPEYSFQAPTGPAPTITSSGTEISVTGSNFEVVFSKSTGMISSGSYGGSTVLTGGPYLNLGNATLGTWGLASINSTTSGNEAVITIVGSYGGTLGTTFVVKIDGEGHIATTYTLANNPPSIYTEVGVAYNVSGTASTLTWKRQGMWSSYPADNIGRNQGTASKTKTAGLIDTFGVQPAWSYSLDEKTYADFGPSDPGNKGTTDFRSSKMNFIYGSLVLAGSNNRLRAEGDGTGSVRAAISGDNVRFNINNLWSVTDMTPCCNGLYKTISISSGYSNTVHMRLTNNDSFTTVYKANLASTATPSTTSNNGVALQQPAQAIDGNATTGYVSANSPGFPQYFTLNWAFGQTFSRIAISCSFCIGQGITDFDVEVSTDGLTGWTNVASSGVFNYTTNGSNIETKVLTFAQVANKKGVRIKVNNANLAWNHYVINEFAVYNDPLASLATASATSNNGVAGQQAAQAIDGSTATGYVSADSPGSPQYFMLNWPSGQSFNGISISCSYCQGQGITNFDVEVSEDGSTGWTNVASSGAISYTTNSTNIETKELTFAQVTNKKGVRIKINNANLTWQHFVIIEFVVSNNPSAVVLKKVMPLGDSITDGYNVSGGYRIKLWDRIVNNGLGIDFVGSSSNGPSSLTDKNHEGHTGWRIDQITEHIMGWMDASLPQIVLLQIGTNDIAQNYELDAAPDRLSNVIDLIVSKLPSGGKLYVATITPLSDPTLDAKVITYNNALIAVVQGKANQGKPVHAVDVYNALTTSDLADGMHPNASGYDKMGDLWFDTIQADLTAAL